MEDFNIKNKLAFLIMDFCSNLKLHDVNVCINLTEQLKHRDLNVLTLHSLPTSRLIKRHQKPK